MSYFLSNIYIEILNSSARSYDNYLKNYIELLRNLEKNEVIDQLAIAYFALGEDYEKYNLYNKAIRFFSLAGTNFKSFGNEAKLVESLETKRSVYHTGKLQNG